MAGTASRPHVVIIGGGFGGLTAARALQARPRRRHADRSQQSPHVSAAALSGRDGDTQPERHHRADSSRPAKPAQRDGAAGGGGRRSTSRERTLTIDDGQGRARTIAYDYLIVAAGARHAYFGHDSWETDAPGLKTIDDALEIRRRFLLAFERAELTDDPEERSACMTIVVIGGGPTGVELAGLMPDVLRGVRRDFRRIDPSRAHVILIEGGPRLLATFPEEISNRALADLRELGVDVRLNSVVTRVGGAQGVHRRRLHRDPQRVLGRRQRRIAARARARRPIGSRRTRAGQPRSVGAGSPGSVRRGRPRDADRRAGRPRPVGRARRRIRKGSARRRTSSSR